jgi:hypothetical protein
MCRPGLMLASLYLNPIFVSAASWPTAKFKTPYSFVCVEFCQRFLLLIYGKDSVGPSACLVYSCSAEDGDGTLLRGGGTMLSRKVVVSIPNEVTGFFHSA